MNFVEIFENSFIADQLRANVSTLGQTVPENLVLLKFRKRICDKAR